MNWAQTTKSSDLSKTSVDCNLLCLFKRTRVSVPTKKPQLFTDARNHHRRGKAGPGLGRDAGFIGRYGGGNDKRKSLGIGSSDGSEYRCGQAQSTSSELTISSGTMGPNRKSIQVHIRALMASMIGWRKSQCCGQKFKYCMKLLVAAGS